MKNKNKVEVHVTMIRPDGGRHWSVTCNRCGDTVEVYEHQIPRPRCKCGFRWFVDLNIVGVKDED